jgi:hypothetical protein
MTHEAFPNTPLATTLKELFSDVSDLVRKEIRLARAEIGEKISTALEAGIWMAIAAVLVMIAGLLVIQALVFGIASLGIGVHWACLIVAAFLTAIAGGSFFYGRSKTQLSIRPSRTIAQIEKDMRMVGSD